jgi:NADH-quinone oxidoreductase subunit A
MLKSYLPILVFAFLGLTVGGAFVMLNHLIGPKRPKRPTSASRRQGETYESGIPVAPARNLRFGVSFYMVAILFILFDIEVVFLYPAGVVLGQTESVFVLASISVFVLFLAIALVYEWAKGGLDWR